MNIIIPSSDILVECEMYKERRIMKNLTLFLIALIIAPLSPLFAKQIDCVVKVVDIMGRPVQGAEVSVW